MLGDRQLKIYKSHYSQEGFTAPAAVVDTDHSSYLRFGASDGWVYADEVQIEGKKRMAVGDFLRGYRSLQVVFESGC